MKDSSSQRASRCRDGMHTDKNNAQGSSPWPRSRAGCLLPSPRLKPLTLTRAVPDLDFRLPCPVTGWYGFDNASWSCSHDEGRCQTSHSPRGPPTYSFSRSVSNCIDNHGPRFIKLELTTARDAGGLDYGRRPKDRNARQCFHRCTCNRVPSTRFECR
jgi:hypothetical protein